MSRDEIIEYIVDNSVDFRTTARYITGKIADDDDSAVELITKHVNDTTDTELLTLHNSMGLTVSTKRCVVMLVHELNSVSEDMTTHTKDVLELMSAILKVNTTKDMISAMDEMCSNDDNIHGCFC